MSPRRFSLLEQERAVLVETLDRLAADLGEQLQNERGLFSNRIDELSDLLLFAQAYGDLARSGDIRVFLRRWHQSAQSRLEELIAYA